MQFKLRNKNAAVKRCFKKYFFYILLQVSVRPDMYAEFSWLFLPAAILCTLRNSCHWLGKVWFVPMKYLKAHKIRSQLTNLFATKGRFPEKKRPHGKIQNSSKDDRRWNALHWGTGFPRLQSKYHWKSSLFWLGKAGCLKVSSRLKNSHLEKFIAVREGSLLRRKGSENVVVIHLAMDTRLLTPDSRRQAQVLTVHRPGQ